MTYSSLMKMAKKFSKRVENTEGKGEIARYEQFPLFLQCFQNTCTGLFRKGLEISRLM